MKVTHFFVAYTSVTLELNDTATDEEILQSYEQALVKANSHAPYWISDEDECIEIERNGNVATVNYNEQV